MHNGIEMMMVEVGLVEAQTVLTPNKCGRGPAKCTEFDKLRKHGKISLKIKAGQTATCCKNATMFTARVTWILKHHADMSILVGLMSPQPIKMSSFTVCGLTLFSIGIWITIEKLFQNNFESDLTLFTINSTKNIWLIQVTKRRWPMGVSWWTLWCGLSYVEGGKAKHSRNFQCIIQRIERG
ncbi:hypothetical protein I3843_11G144900 [Carya illinoinensis]|nr:hypothetical protein I3843_11G144900 [Carya illinoinensis]